MTGVGAAPCRPVGAEDIRDLERRTRQGKRSLTPVVASSRRDAGAGCGLMGASVMECLPEVGLNTRSSDRTPVSVIGSLLDQRLGLREALYRESGLVRWHF